MEELCDYQLHKYCLKYPSLNSFKLSNEILEDCGKIQSLKSLLNQLKEKKHRVLLFSQMTKVLDILEEILSYWRYSFLRLDGATPVADRQVYFEFYLLILNIIIIIIIIKFLLI